MENRIINIHKTPGDPYTKDKNKDRWLKIWNSGASVDYNYMPFDLIGVTPAYFKFGNNLPSDIYPVYISDQGSPWTGFLVRQDLGDSCLVEKCATYIHSHSWTKRTG